MLSEVQERKAVARSNLWLVKAEHGYMYTVKDEFYDLINVNVEMIPQLSAHIWMPKLIKPQIRYNFVI